MKKNLLIASEEKLLTSTKLKSTEPAWKMVGSFGDKDWGWRKVEYRSSENPLNKIFLRQTPSKDILIELELTNREEMEVIRRTLIQKTYPPRCFLDTVYTLSVCMQNLKFMLDFLSILSETLNHFNEISEDIFNTARGYLTNRYVVDGWIKCRTEGVQTSFTNRRQDSRITEINWDFSKINYHWRFILAVIVEKELIEEFKKFLLEKQCPRSETTDNYGFEVKSTQKLEIFLTVLAEFDRSISLDLQEQVVSLHSYQYVSPYKIAFFAGFHERVGAESAIQKFKNEKTFDKNVMPLIFSYL